MRTEIKAICIRDCGSLDYGNSEWINNSIKKGSIITYTVRVDNIMLIDF